MALDFDREKINADSPSYAQKCQLPDGQEVTLGQEKFLCPEVLFQADLIGERREGARGEARRSQWGRCAGAGPAATRRHRLQEGVGARF